MYYFEKQNRKEQIVHHKYCLFSDNVINSYLLQTSQESHILKKYRILSSGYTVVENVVWQGEVAHFRIHYILHNPI